MELEKFSIHFNIADQFALVALLLIILQDLRLLNHQVPLNLARLGRQYLLNHRLQDLVAATRADFRLFFKRQSWLVIDLLSAAINLGGKLAASIIVAWAGIILKAREDVQNALLLL